MYNHSDKATISATSSREPTIQSTSKPPKVPHGITVVNNPFKLLHRTITSTSSIDAGSKIERTESQPERLLKAKLSSQKSVASIVSVSNTPEVLAERQKEEIEALEAIFGDEFERIDLFGGDSSSEEESDSSDSSSSSDDFFDRADDHRQLDANWSFNYVLSEPMHRFVIKIVPHQGEVEENHVYADFEIEFDKNYPVNPPSIRIKACRGLPKKAQKELEGICTGT